jgi:hypothetical protein
MAAPPRRILDQLDDEDDFFDEEDTKPRLLSQFEGEDDLFDEEDNEKSGEEEEEGDSHLFKDARSFLTKDGVFSEKGKKEEEKEEEEEEEDEFQDGRAYLEREEAERYLKDKRDNRNQNYNLVTQRKSTIRDLDDILKKLASEKNTAKFDPEAETQRILEEEIAQEKQKMLLSQRMEREQRMREITMDKRKTRVLVDIAKENDRHERRSKRRDR